MAKMPMLVVLGGFLAGAFMGCGPSDSTKPDAHQHAHRPPHGGTAVVLGKDEFHLELVHEPGSKRINAYVLDGEMEQFVRVEMAEFLVQISSPPNLTLRFTAVARDATGEKVGDTSEFAATADWIAEQPELVFDGLLAEIKIRTHTYREVRFNYPKGNE